MNRATFPKTAQRSLLANLLCAFGHSALGFWAGSWWFVLLGAYYTILSVSRFSLLLIRLRTKGNLEKEDFAQKLTGILLLFLALCLVGIVVLSAVKDRGKHLHQIIVIGMATYSFSRVGVAVYTLHKARHDPSPVVKTLRNISLTTALVSIYSLQRTMLVSFPGMAWADIQLFNILSGSALCLAVALLGILMIGGTPVTRAKAKVTKTVRSVGTAVTAGYKIAETGVVAGYKVIEKGVISGYTKIETYLTRDGETVKEAQKRPKQ